jgi:hypothetical protein
MAKPTSERIRQQRDARISEGWAEVRVWVPSKADAEQVQAFAAELRAKAASFSELMQLDGVGKMDQQRLNDFHAALAEQGSRAYTTHFGAVADLLSDFASEGCIADFARAYSIIARGNPAKAESVGQMIPAKIANNYWIRHRGIDVGAMTSWQKKHTHWADTLKAHVRDPERFVEIVDTMAEDMCR